MEVFPCENFEDLLAESGGVEEGVIDFDLIVAVYFLLLHEVNHENQFLYLFVCKASTHPYSQTFLNQLFVSSAGRYQLVLNCSYVFATVQLSQFSQFPVEFHSGLFGGEGLVDIVNFEKGSLVFSLNVFQKGQFLFNATLAKKQAFYRHLFSLFQCRESIPEDAYLMYEFIHFPNVTFQVKEVLLNNLAFIASYFSYGFHHFGHLLVQSLSALRECIGAQMELKFDHFLCRCRLKIVRLDLDSFIKANLSFQRIFLLNCLTD